MISNRVERTAGVGFGSIYFDWSKCIGRYILLDKFQIQLIPTIPIRQCCREWELICKRYPIRLSLDDPRCRGRWGQKPSHKIVAAPRSKRQRPKKRQRQIRFRIWQQPRQSSVNPPKNNQQMGGRFLIHAIDKDQIRAGNPGFSKDRIWSSDQ